MSALYIFLLSALSLLSSLIRATCIPRRISNPHFSISDEFPSPRPLGVSALVGGGLDLGRSVMSLVHYVIEPFLFLFAAAPPLSLFVDHTLLGPHSPLDLLSQLYLRFLLNTRTKTILCDIVRAPRNKIQLLHTQYLVHSSCLRTIYM